MELGFKLGQEGSKACTLLTLGVALEAPRTLELQASAGPRRDLSKSAPPQVLSSFLTPVALAGRGSEPGIWARFLTSEIRFLPPPPTWLPTSVLLAYRAAFSFLDMPAPLSPPRIPLLELSSSPFRSQLRSRLLSGALRFRPMGGAELPSCLHHPPGRD